MAALNSNELLKQVRKIEIKTRGLSNEIFAGRYHSAFKGRGMSFSEVREYRIGDDVRDIDWNVTARTNSAHIKTFEEERELTMMLIVDVSGSRFFGTANKFKKDMATEIAATLAFSAAHNNDKIGVLFISDTVEKFIPPKKGRSHVLRIIRELTQFTPQSNNTNIGEGLRFLTGAIKKHCTAFLLSDFMDVDVDSQKANFEDALKIAASRHDIVAIRLFDRREDELPNVGIVELCDAETGQKVWVDTSSSKVRDEYAHFAKKRNFLIENTLMRYRVDATSVATDDDYAKALIRLFKQR